MIESCDADTERNGAFGLRCVRGPQVLTKSGHNCGLTMIPGLDGQDREFVSSQAADDIGVSKGFFQNLRCAPQDVIGLRRDRRNR